MIAIVPNQGVKRYTTEHVLQIEIYVPTIRRGGTVRPEMGGILAIYVPTRTYSPYIHAKH